MSGHPQGAQYDDGYGRPGQPAPQGQDSYYHDDQQYGQYQDDARGQQGHYQQNGNDAYYDEQYVLSCNCHRWLHALTLKQGLL